MPVTENAIRNRLVRVCEKLIPRIPVIKSGKINQIGFVVKTMDKYGQSHLPQAHTAFIAIKPR